MTEVDVIEVTREALFVMLQVSAPLLIIGLVVGVAVALLQALTTVQEMTLTFVPKMVAMLLAMLLLVPFMLATMADFTRTLFERVVAGG